MTLLKVTPTLAVLIRGGAGCPIVELRRHNMTTPPSPIQYHAVMLDETHCEFGATIETTSREEAHDLLRDLYPESRCVQLESPTDTHTREQRTYQHILAGGDWDDEGRPIFHYPDEEDEEDNL